MKIVAIGGGTGLSTLLSGLRQFVSESEQGAVPYARITRLTAVVAVTDDGGSSGDFHVPPPGDIRNCLVALSGGDALLSQLFQYRFEAGSGLEGHNFGNLFVTTLTTLTGDFALAVNFASAVLKTCGVVYPITTAHVELAATMDDGTFCYGESNITASARRIVD
jgi:uncharacterized cofD-like protein